MKKIGISLLLVILLTTGCGTASLKNGSSETSKVSGETSESSEMNFMMYRPETGVTKTFKSQGKQLFTEYIVDQNEEYIQRVITLGDMETTQVVQWTKDRASIVEESQSSSKESVLNGYESLEEVETLFDRSEKQDGIEITTVDKVEVPYGSFHDVIQVTKRQDQMIMTIFYAKSVGMIKQVYETTEENAEREIAELTKIE
ncbi:hypothetical protein [Pseudalkalibacillus sp. NRS-1564]|uniref:hypothetical protein n=1 Tax=Pseudalkalibacillus sp. NRS-1564 TaxID=3233900 RepID=UPI003D280D41